MPNRVISLKFTENYWTQCPSLYVIAPTLFNSIIVQRSVQVTELSKEFPLKQRWGVDFYGMDASSSCMHKNPIARTSVGRVIPRTTAWRADSLRPLPEGWHNFANTYIHMYYLNLSP